MPRPGITIFWTLNLLGKTVRVLHLSNYYPPLRNGGYEQLCQETASELADRGHRVCALTSRSRGAAVFAQDEGVDVHRVLNLETEAGLADTTVRLLIHRERLERENLENVRTLVGSFHPDAALIWGMWNVPRSVPALLERLLPGRVAYYLCDYWPSLPSAYVQQLQAPARHGFTELPKRLVGRSFLLDLAKKPAPLLSLERPLCVSEAVRDGLAQAGVPLRGARVIHNGIRLSDFAFGQPNGRDTNAGGFKLLFAGRLVAEKGVHTAIRALALSAGRGGQRVTLDILGAGDSAYERSLRIMVEQYHLDGRVFFRSSVPRADMPAVLAKYDALVFPSEWDEPLARIVMEAMAAGLVVVGTATGGTVEVLVDGVTGLTFPPSHAEALAVQIERLRDDPALRSRLALAARQRIETGFTFSRMVDQLEAVLQEMVECASN